MLKVAEFLKSLHSLKKINAMSYCGGKFRVRKEIGEYLNNIRKDGQAYYEPFVGSAWILSQIKDGPN